MRVHTLRCELITRSSLDHTFSIFEDPYNLAKITPPWLNFKVTSKDEVKMQAGAEIFYTIRWLGIPIHWMTTIREYQPPDLFVDEQTKGPYTLWRHRHTFEAISEGTRVADHVDYALPLGLAGELAHQILVRKQLIGIFDFRQKALGEILRSETKQTVAPYVV